MPAHCAGMVVSDEQCRTERRADSGEAPANNRISRAFRHFFFVFRAKSGVWRRFSGQKAPANRMVGRHASGNRLMTRHIAIPYFPERRQPPGKRKKLPHSDSKRVASAVGATGRTGPSAIGAADRTGPERDWSGGCTSRPIGTAKHADPNAGRQVARTRSNSKTHNAWANEKTPAY